MFDSIKKKWFEIFIIIIGAYICSQNSLSEQMASKMFNGYGIPKYLSYTFIFLCALGIFYAALRLLFWYTGKVKDKTIFFLIDHTIGALIKWAEQNKDIEKCSDNWKWFHDKMLAVQERYAFALSCIVFDKRDSKIEVLLIDRKFRGYEHNVLLWPGGRFFGIHDDTLMEVKNIVNKETGMKIDLLNCSIEDIASIGSDGSEIVNHLVTSPFRIMVEKKEQRNGVKGHIDLIYIGKLAGERITKANLRWIKIADLSNKEQYPVDYLWPDTRKIIEDAAKVAEDLLK